MLAPQRHTYILERIARDGAVRVADLVDELRVSDMTIRRDLSTMAQAGLLDKVHGGATRIPDGTAFEPEFGSKVALQRAEKEAIAIAAAGLVEAGMAVGISAGTTTHAIALRLLEVPRLTVVTNSVRVWETLSERGRDDQEVLLTGGVRTPSDALVGPFATANLHAINVDIVFMGVHGMDDRSGFTTPNLLEAETDRALIAAGRKLVVATDHTKWGVTGISSIADLSEADVLITDDGLPEAARTVLGETVGELVLVTPTLTPRETAE